MKKIYFLLFFIIIILVIYLFYKITFKKSIYWHKSQINNYLLKKNNNKIVINNINKINNKNNIYSKKLYLKRYNFYEKIYFDFNKKDSQLIDFLNTYYDDDIIFDKRILKYLKEYYNPNNFYLNIIYNQNNNIIGSIIFKNVKIKILNNIENIMIVDLGCINKNYRGKYLFPHLINNALNIMKKNKIKYAIHKKDRNDLPIKNHFKIYYYFYFIDNKLKNNRNNKIYNKINSINQLNYIYNIFSKIVKNFKISINFNKDDFNLEFFNSFNQITYFHINDFILLNGFFQIFKKNDKKYKVFEIRYLFYEKETINLINIIKHILSVIVNKYNIDILIFQDFGLNNILNKVLSFTKGHQSNIYILNLGINNFKNNEYCFHF